MPNPIYGTNGDDWLNVVDGITNGPDQIYGFAGDDTVFASAGDDWIKGGGGADYMDGEGGNDVASYEDSTSGVAVDLSSGIGEGGFAEGDQLAHIENLIGSSYSDHLFGDDGVNVLSGLAGNDVLDGDMGADTLYGESGNDTLKGGGGADTINGGSGVDTASYLASITGVVVSLTTNLGAYGHADGDVLVSIENLTGSAHPDSLFGNAGNNVLVGFDGNDALNGMSGNDTLDGGNGNDTLDGGAGADTMTGGLGNDWFYVNTAADVVIDGSFMGNDRVLASADYTLGGGVWVETMSTTDNFGAAPIDLTGNGIDNTIYGNIGSNILNGMGGADIMLGSGGNDWYYVDDAADSVHEALFAGADRVLASVSYTLANAMNKEIEMFTTTNNFGLDAIDLTGNYFGNAIYGNNGSNAINGGAGNDTLVGNGGMDAFVFDTALNVATNVDNIADFSVVDDTIQLENAVFGALGLGALAAAAFRTGAAAADASDRIVYNSGTGALLYDADGLNGAAGIQFATLDIGLALTSADFIVV